MIVADSNVDYSLIRRYVSEPELFVQAVECTVPVWCRHLTAIVQNQRYMYAVYTRNLVSIPYKQKQAMIQALLNGVSITGTTTTFVGMIDILNTCNKKKLTEMLEAKRDGLL